MEENDAGHACGWCGRPIDPDSERRVAVVKTLVDVRTAEKETDETPLCADCGFDPLDPDRRFRQRT